MPPQPCNKCRAVPAVEGDTWCYCCAGWEALGRELTASWDSPGARRLAADLAVTAARQVRALRSLSAGLARQPEVSRSAGTTGAPRASPVARRGRESDRGQRERRERSRSRRGGDKHLAPKEEEESEEEDLDQEPEEDERRRSRARSPSPLPRSRGGDRRPPEPEGPPYPGAKPLPVPLSKGEDTRRSSRRSHHSDHHQIQRHSGRTKTGKTRRAGRKHLRLHRLAEDPTLRIHRPLSGNFLELATSQPGALDLDNLGR